MSQGKPRDARKEQLWRQRGQQERASGLTVRAFCEQQGLATSSFYAWRRELQRRHPAPTFVPVRLVLDERPAPNPTIDLVLPGNHTVRVAPGFDAGTLRQLLAVLEERHAELSPGRADLAVQRADRSAPQLRPAGGNGPPTFPRRSPVRACLRPSRGGKKRQKGDSVTFTATATGTPTPTEQWQVSTDGGLTFADIAGATTTSLTFTTSAGQNGYRFRAVFTNADGTATSKAAKLIVRVPGPLADFPGKGQPEQLLAFGYPPERADQFVAVLPIGELANYDSSLPTSAPPVVQAGAQGAAPAGGIMAPHRLAPGTKALDQLFADPDLGWLSDTWLGVSIAIGIG